MTSCELRVGRHTRIGRKIGHGSFGEIYLGTNVISGQEVAIKLEPVKAQHPQLLYEAKLMKMLSTGTGFPRVYDYGVEGDFVYLVMELLGPNIEELFNFCQRSFSLKTILMLADQMLSRIEYMHNQDFIHRDIKPDNFLMGLGKKATTLYFIDFGLSKKYRHHKTHQHIPYRDNKNLTGTARYASINNHLGIEQSRRDDLETLGYLLMYLNRGSLPWQGLKADTKKRKYEKIADVKMQTSVQELCVGYSGTAEFGTYLNYVKGLRFEDKPDYLYLRTIFRDLFAREGYEWDYIFDWMIKKEPSSGKASTTAKKDVKEKTMTDGDSSKEETPAPATAGTATVTAAPTTTAAPAATTTTTPAPG